MAAGPVASSVPVLRPQLPIRTPAKAEAPATTPSVALPKVNAVPSREDKCVAPAAEVHAEAKVANVPEALLVSVAWPVAGPSCALT